jgi:glucose/arabinose dehydrogenase
MERRELLTTLPTGFSETVVAGGIALPTAMDIAPDGRLFVAQQSGQLRIIKNGSLLATPFASLDVDSSGERGLLGVAFDPNFASNGYVYVYYTVPGSPAHNRIGRLTAQGDVAAAGSLVTIFDIDALSADTRHNGGAIHFGADGKLYIAVGDNKATGDAQQHLDNMKGKILRIKADGSIPTDNPFYNQASGPNRAIWAVGLRNPYSFAFQPGTGRMFINDVGENTWEEIDDGIAGSNYGWPTTEGPTNDPRFRSPLYAYQHTGPFTAITGGAFYNPAVVQFPPAYTGTYFFADYAHNWIRDLDPATRTAVDFATGLPEGAVDLKVDAAGSLYYLAGPGTSSGFVGRIDYANVPPPPTGDPPTILQQPSNVSVYSGQSATFQVFATGSPSLSYQWFRDGRAIPGAVLPTYGLGTTQASDNNAAFSVMVSNRWGAVASTSAVLSVRVNQPPSPVIFAPAFGSTYAGGQVIDFRGGASDPEDGALPAASLTWRVDRIDTTGVQSIVPPTSGRSSGSFLIPATGPSSTSAIYRVTLTATDSVGLARSTSVDIQPQVVNLGLFTSPAGIAVLLDGQALAAPTTVRGVSGMVWSLSVPTTQVLAGSIYQFAGWSDGDTQASRTITVPATDSVLTATYQFVGVVPYVTIQSAVARSRGGQVTQVVLNLSGPLDPSSARNRRGYWLVMPGRDRILGTRDDRRMRFRTARYVAGSTSISLVPGVRVGARQKYRVVAVASGTQGVLLDILGRPLDGDGDGQPGGDFVTTFPRGASALSLATRPRVRAASAARGTVPDGDGGRS